MKKNKKPELILKNYQDKNWKDENLGKSGGWFNNNPALPSYVPRSLITRDYKDNPSRYLGYLEMPDQIMEFGDEVQKGLVKCMWKVMQETGNSSTFSDVNSKSHPLYKCLGCDGLSFECDGYRYQLKELRAYNSGLRGLEND